MLCSKISADFLNKQFIIYLSGITKELLPHFNLNLNKLSVRTFQHRDTPVPDLQDGSQFTLEILCFFELSLTMEQEREEY